MRVRSYNLPADCPCGRDIRRNASYSDAILRLAPRVRRPKQARNAGRGRLRATFFALSGGINDGVTESARRMAPGAPPRGPHPGALWSPQNALRLRTSPLFGSTTKRL